MAGTAEGPWVYSGRKNMPETKPEVVKGASKRLKRPVKLPPEAKLDHSEQHAIIEIKMKRSRGNTK